MNTIIYLFGPSGAGKSTVADLLKNSIDDLNVIDFDVIKRQIPSYNWKLHAQDGRDMTLEELARATKESLPILLLYPSSKDVQEYERINSIANESGHHMINIHIMAPRAVLIDRYKQRLESIDPAKKDWKFKTLDEFTEKLQEEYYIPSDTISFDSSEESADNITARIIEKL